MAIQRPISDIAIWVKAHAPLATHKRPNGSCLSPVEAECQSRGTASSELGDKCDKADQDSISPCNTIAEETQICFETGQREIL